MPYLFAFCLVRKEMINDTYLFDRMERWRRDGEGSRQSQDLFELENESDVDDDIAYSRR